ncbi:MAG: DUF349 domain-containing protein [Gammaproteobacteria bacterium]|nr:DUF349 domain-containing protein [Gammaproteobacteria bacterium]
MLERIFNRKPRLDHPNAEKRLEALATLSSSDQDTILSLAREDTSIGVRTAALKRLTSLDELSNFLDDEELANEAVQLVCAQIDTKHSLLSHENVRNYMLEHIESGSELVEIAQQQNSTQDIAETIFLASSATVRHDAVALIANVEVLSHCERISRNKDKSVNRFIRDRLSEVKRLQANRDETLARAEQLIESATRTTATDAHYASLREAQETSWAEILGELTELNKRLQEFGVENLDLDMLRTRFPRRAKSIDENAEDPARFTAIIAALNQAENQTEALENAEKAWLEALRAQKVPLELSNQFFELTARIRSEQKHDVVVDRLAERFEKLTSVELAIPDLKVKENWANVWRVSKLAKDHRQNIERFVEHRDFVSLDTETQSRWRQQLTELSQHCQTIIERVDQLFDETLKGIDDTMPSLKEKIQEGALQQAINTERHARNLILRLPEGARKRQFDLLAPLSAELKQLLNWKAFATLPKREELCSKIESLRDSPLPPQQQFDQVRALRADWNALGPPSNRDEVSLQKRYDDAAEGAWRICAEWFEEQKRHRVENTNRKEALARELENVIEDTDWDAPDWREVQHVLSQHLKQFKEVGDTDRSRSRAVNKRFFSAYQTIRDRLIKHRQETSKVKEILIEQAKEVCNQEELDDQERINAIKGLQAEWKAVGPTFHKAEERLWNEFRTLCNSVFETRRVQREERKETITKNIEQAKDMVDKLLRRARGGKQQFNVNAVHEVEEQLAELVLPARIKKDLDRKLAQVDDILADRKLAALQMEASERLKLLLEKDAELAGYETSDSPIPVEWYDAVQNDMILFESRTPLNDDSTLRDIVLRAEIQAEIEPANTEDEDRRLQLRVGALATTMGRSEVSQKEIAEGLIRDWVAVAHGEQPMRERFNRAMDLLLKRLGD